MTADTHPYAGFYINLNRSPARRREIEAGLRALGIEGRYRRFPAVDGATIENPGRLKPGQAGCFHSHYEVLRQGEKTGLPLHIIEDDILFSDKFDQVARTIVSNKLLDRYDIIFTDTFVHTDLNHLAFLKNAYDQTMKGEGNTFKVLGLKETQLACTSSYFVSAASVKKVAALRAEELAAGLTMPNDLFLRRMANTGKLRMGCWFPFVTTIRLEHIMATSIEGREKQVENLSVLASALLRYSFFMGRDLEGYAKKFLAALNAGAERNPDTHKDLLMDVLEFTLSERYRAF